jgi:hypothetical protein
MLSVFDQKLITRHTTIIAQSGSGKSFFLGRLIEEILIRTRARCLVFDPNGDFRRAYEIEADKLWDNVAYEPQNDKYKLPTEKDRNAFLEKWNPLTICIYGSDDLVSNLNDSDELKEPTHSAKPLELSWTDVEVDSFAEDLDPKARLGLLYCHEFVRCLEYLFYHTAKKSKIDLLSEAQDLISKLHQEPDDFRKTVEARFPLPSSGIRKLSPKRPIKGEKSHGEDIWSWREWLISTAEYVSEENYYFAKARDYFNGGILDVSVKKSFPEPVRLEVIDLPSLSDRRMQHLAIYGRVKRLWDDAREEWSEAMETESEQDQRVPTFVVLDEAHNIIPADPQGKPEAILRDLFRTIVAEGRKYGLFLILVTQRPDKVDPMILSECDNVAVMRINSEPIATKIADILGMDALSEKILQECLRFDPGRVFLTGQWMPDRPRTAYVAARRTVEGGRNLREKYWARPEEGPRSVSSKKSTKSKSASKKPVTKK